MLTAEWELPAVVEEIQGTLVAALKKLNNHKMVYKKTYNDLIEILNN